MSFHQPVLRFILWRWLDLCIPGFSRLYLRFRYFITFGHPIFLIKVIFEKFSAKLLVYLRYAFLISDSSIVLKASLLAVRNELSTFASDWRCRTKKSVHQ